MRPPENHCLEAFDIEKNIWKTVNYITDNLKLRTVLKKERVPVVITNMYYLAVWMFWGSALAAACCTHQGFAPGTHPLTTAIVKITVFFDLTAGLRPWTRTLDHFPRRGFTPRPAPSTISLDNILAHFQNYEISEIFCTNGDQKRHNFVPRIFLRAAP
jgi:hypothetical protein